MVTSQVQAAMDLNAACMVSWRVLEKDLERRCDAFTSAFAAHGVQLDGRAFLLGLGALCGHRPHGSLIDSKSRATRASERLTPSEHHDALRLSRPIIPPRRTLMASRLRDLEQHGLAWLSSSRSIRWRRRFLAPDQTVREQACSMS